MSDIPCDFFGYFQSNRQYVPTKDNKALKESIDLVLKFNVPKNTASLRMGVPRTTLSKLELVDTGSTLNPKKRVYNVDRAHLTIPSPVKQKSPSPVKRVNKRTLMKSNYRNRSKQSYFLIN